MFVINDLQIHQAGDDQAQHQRQQHDGHQDPLLEEMRFAKVIFESER